MSKLTFINSLIAFPYPVNACYVLRKKTTVTISEYAGVKYLMRMEGGNLTHRFTHFLLAYNYNLLLYKYDTMIQTTLYYQANREIIGNTN